MHTGEPIFPGRNEYDLIFKMVEVLDMPPDWMVSASEKGKKFFTFRGRLRIKLLLKIKKKG